MNLQPDSKPQLEDFLRRCIAERGSMSFVEFMGHCLYHPEWGYYVAPRQRIGKEGDFFTSSSVHAVFGRLLFRQVRQMAQILAAEAFTLVEQGAGEGHLALDILDAAAEQAPELYRRMTYVLVEVGSDVRRRQEQLLAPHVAAGRVRWADFEQLDGLEGVFLSNELVDAFPVHLVEQTAQGLREVYVDWRDGEFREELRAPSTARIETHLAELGVSLPVGNRAEVNLAAADWMQDVAAKLRRGFVITIDYGYPAAELYAPLRRNGTLMCYHRHQTSENPLAHVGCQDITSHVDFTTLQRSGEPGGLRPLFFGPQYRFLMGLGFVEMLMELEAREPDPNRARNLRLTLKNLIMPEAGMGETFKVLVQGKEVGAPPLHCQRTLADIRLPLG
ncbi:class I SAM-dependent methyltransferase [Geoalkalibacter halelectricus]|uniref:SAM-dependent methyltransferase n=1 Tax=Geoalkalibacter halelectricus TaxID=2847045 RepID=A0ABY5ZSP4_9BACT|nr:SAM-dependent methyltransferase [Geoalkalibacter halelectricus]MDO3379219.1 SAM-dependent methyltransferase [Geoalkalibacter halelectricus]UWZ80977.1 SAM-dependent methyltransferase [Geoalkalibacter halelectricus]